MTENPIPDTIQHDHETPKPSPRRRPRHRFPPHGLDAAGAAILYAALAVLTGCKHGPLCGEAVIYAALSCWHLITILPMLLSLWWRRGPF